MKIAILASNEQWDELIDHVNKIRCIRILPGEINSTNADCLIVLIDISVDFTVIKKPIFINSVVHTLKDLNTPGHVVRINGWKSFLKRPVWEIAGNLTDEIKQVMHILGKNLIPVLDEPGLVSARIIAMIINEAFFALGDDVSTEAAIDLAMKTGTNYPYGPFEWATLIGEKNIYGLLEKLSETDCSYLPAPLLKEKALK